MTNLASDPLRGMPHWAQQTAALVVACLVLAGLFAGALMGWFGAENTALIVRLCIALAGAGFAGFLMGHFEIDLPVGVKAGGALGVLALLWLTNPGKDLPAAVQKCQVNVQNEAYDVAVASCRLASNELPEDYEPAFLLGQAYYHLGQYNLAIQSWKMAIERGADPAPLKYSMGLARLDDSKFDDAAAQAKEAASETTDPSLLARIWYLAGDAIKVFGTSAKGRRIPSPTR